jgi:hypothetical protein
VSYEEEDTCAEACRHTGRNAMQHLAPFLPLPPSLPPSLEVPQAFRRGEHMGRVVFDPRSFFPGTAGHPCLTLLTTCNVPFPPRRSGE